MPRYPTVARAITLSTSSIISCIAVRVLINAHGGGGGGGGGGGVNCSVAFCCTRVNPFWSPTSFLYLS